MIIAKMINRKCMFCGKPIDRTNSSIEHVLLQSLGGTLEINNVICQNCNNKYGKSIDAALYSNISPLASILDAKRKRGDNKNIFNETDNELYYMYEEIPIALRFNKDNFPSAIKSALEFAYIASEDITMLKPGIDHFLRNEYLNCKYLPGFSIKLSHTSVFHLLSLQKSNKTHQCFVIVSYFGIYNFIVLLDDNYCGVDCNNTYIHDIINNCDKFVSNRLDLSCINFYDQLIFEEIDLVECAKNNILNFAFCYAHKKDLRKIYQYSVELFKKNKNLNLDQSDIDVFINSILKFRWIDSFNNNAFYAKDVKIDLYKESIKIAC